MAERRHAWLQHYGWFTDLVIELLDDQPGKTLDGWRSKHFDRYPQRWL